MEDHHFHSKCFLYLFILFIRNQCFEFWNILTDCLANIIPDLKPAHITCILTSRLKTCRTPLHYSYALSYAVISTPETCLAFISIYAFRNPPVVGFVRSHGINSSRCHKNISCQTLFENDIGKRIATQKRVTIGRTATLFKPGGLQSLFAIFKFDSMRVPFVIESKCRCRLHSVRFRPAVLTITRNRFVGEKHAGSLRHTRSTCRCLPRAFRWMAAVVNFNFERLLGSYAFPTPVCEQHILTWHTVSG